MEVQQPSSDLQLRQRTLGDQSHTYYEDEEQKKQGAYIVEFHTAAQPATIHEIRYYKDNQLHGPITTFYLNKKVARSGNYQNGEKHGTFTYYDSQGVVSQIEQYKKGERHGTWQTFHANGKKSSQQKFRNGTQVDLDYAWAMNGQLVACVNTRR
jgi:antitoxin component YwqK of YwqJK toxin-antitoxin module